MTTKLIIVEGIPGSGKSTTAKFISDWLVEHGFQTHLHCEGSASHPTALDGLAFLAPGQYGTFLASQPQYLACLNRSVTEIVGGYLFNYWGMKKAGGGSIPDDLFDSLRAYDVYDTLSADRKRRLSLARWRAFADQMAKSEDVYIFECCFLQDTLTVLLGQHNSDLEIVRKHILEVANLVADLNPALVYLDVEDVRKILEMAVETRPQAWINLVTEYFTGQGYGKAKGLVGFEGVVAFYELMHAEQTEILSRLGWRTLNVDVSRRDWDRVHEQISGFLATTF